LEEFPYLVGKGHVGDRQAEVGPTPAP
jgi:hypothetical protein